MKFEKLQIGYFAHSSVKTSETRKVEIKIKDGNNSKNDEYTGEVTPAIKFQLIVNERDATARNPLH